MLLLALHENICDLSTYLFIFKSRCVLLWIALSFMERWGWMVGSEMGISFSLPKYGRHRVSKLLIGPIMVLCIFLAQLNQEAAINPSVGNRGTEIKPGLNLHPLTTALMTVQNRGVLVPWPRHFGSSVLGLTCWVLRVVYFLFSSSYVRWELNFRSSQPHNPAQLAAPTTYIHISQTPSSQYAYM